MGLVDVPFDTYLPWCFMGEEIALSLRAWTHGWDIYAPRENLIAHQYRPGRMGLPKFWENTGRVFGRPGPGFNTKLQAITIQRIKYMVGYPGPPGRGSRTRGSRSCSRTLRATAPARRGRGWSSWSTCGSRSISTRAAIDWCNDCSLE